MSATRAKDPTVLGFRTPVLVAAAVAILGIAGMLLVDHGPWNKPKLQTAETRMYSTTGAAAKAGGATVTQTDPRSEIEPEPPGPKPVAPAVPETR